MSRFRALGLQKREKQHRSVQVSGGGPFSPLDLSPEIFAIVDDDYIIKTTTISSITNQGTLGGNFTQGTAGAQPTYTANHFGAGKHAAYFDYGDFLAMANVNPNSSQMTIAAGGYITAVGDYLMVISWGSVNDYAYLASRITTGLIYGVHDTDGLSARLGTSDWTSAKTAISTHDISLATEEVQLYINGTLEDNGNLGLNANNTTGFNTSQNMNLGAWTDQSSYKMLGYFRWWVVCFRKLTAQEIQDLSTWGMGELGL